MKLNQKGAISPLLIILLIIVIGMTGFLFWSISQKDSLNTQKQSLTNDQKEQANPEENEQESVDFEEPTTDYDTSDWEEVDVNGKFSFKYPTDQFTPFVKCVYEDWVYARYEDKLTDPSLDSTAQVNTMKCGGWGMDHVIFGIKAFDGDGTSASGASAPEKIQGESTKLTVDGTTGEKICKQGKETPLEGKPAVVRKCQYNFQTQDKQIWVNYTQLENERNQTELIDAVVSTLVFNN